MKKYLPYILAIAVMAGAVYLFAHEPVIPLGDGESSTTTATSTEPLPPVEPAPPRIRIPTLSLTQVEAEYIQVDENYNHNGLLYYQLLYAEDTKLKKDKLSEYKENPTTIQLENTELAEAEVLTLYVRGKGDGTATLKIGEAELITLTLEKDKWLTKYDSADVYSLGLPMWTRGQINNARVEFTGDIKVSSVYLYAEDQHSLTDNFEAYTLDPLPGQGGWGGDSNYVVQNASTSPGSTKGVIIDHYTTDVSITKSFSTTTTGIQTYYTQISGNTGGRSPAVQFMEGDTVHLRVILSSGTREVKVSGDGQATVGVYVDNNWLKIDFEWDGPNDRGRAQLDDGGYSDWISTNQGSFAGLNKVRLNNSRQDESIYWDDFSDPSPPAAAEDEPPQEMLIYD